jgi:hypothetical protein
METKDPSAYAICEHVQIRSQLPEFLPHKPRISNNRLERVRRAVEARIQHKTSCFIINWYVMLAFASTNFSVPLDLLFFSVIS